MLKESIKIIFAGVTIATIFTLAMLLSNLVYYGTMFLK